MTEEQKNHRYVVKEIAGLKNDIETAKMQEREIDILTQVRG